MSLPCVAQGGLVRAGTQGPSRRGGGQRPAAGLLPAGACVLEPGAVCASAVLPGAWRSGGLVGGGGPAAGGLRWCVVRPCGCLVETWSGGRRLLESWRLGVAEWEPGSQPAN